MGEKTLEQVLRASTEPMSQQEFRLVAIRHPGGDALTFYLHPLGKDGETGDYEAVDNAAIPYQWSATQDPDKDGLDWRVMDPPQSSDNRAEHTAPGVGDEQESKGQQ